MGVKKDALAPSTVVEPEPKKELKPRSRTRLDIIRDALVFAGSREEGRSKTHIMYGSNMNYIEITSYLKFMLDSGMLVRGSGRKGPVLYSLSEKGRKFLGLYEELKKLVNSESST